MFKFRFRLKDLLYLILVVAAILGCTSGEEYPVALAAVYCYISIIAIVLISLLLSQQTWRAYTKKPVRIRQPIVYLLIATIVLTWTMSVTAIANEVVENYTSRGIWLLYLSVPSAIFAVWFIFRR